MPQAKQKPDLIEVWRPVDFPELELRRGFGVARPVPRHWHEEYQFCLIQAGPSELNYRGTTLPSPPGSLFMVHPGEVHSNRAHDALGCSYRTLFVGTEVMRSAAAEIYGRKSSLPFFPTAVTFDNQLIGKYLKVHGAMEAESSSLERESLLLDLLISLLKRFGDERIPVRKFSAEPKAVERARHFLMDHYTENITLEQLAQIARLSLYHFNRVFSEQFGLPPHAFQTQLRVARAKELLRKGWSISQVAAETGFTDQSHLNRHFRRLCEPSPGVYRQGNKFSLA